MTSTVLPALPSDDDVSRALFRFGRSAKRHYGARLVGLYLFGSRARQDHGPESDADLALILADPIFDRWDELKVTTNFSYDELVEHGVDIQCHFVTQRSWNDPSLHANPSLIRNMRRDSQSLSLE